VNRFRSNLFSGFISAAFTPPNTNIFGFILASDIIPAYNTSSTSSTGYINKSS
jgi:hypothetical protein